MEEKNQQVAFHSELLAQRYMHFNDVLSDKRKFCSWSVQEIPIPMGFPIAYLNWILLFIVTFIEKLIAEQIALSHIV